MLSLDNHLERVIEAYFSDIHSVEEVVLDYRNLLPDIKNIIQGSCQLHQKTNSPLSNA